MKQKTAVLLLYLGTPASTHRTDIRRYLRTFLSDPRVVSLPYVLRALLVSCIIVPLRWRKTQHAYTQIWTQNGSPLLTHCLSVQKALQKALDQHADVYLGMRYEEPSLSTALNTIKSYNYPRLFILPLYPQYASASTGSALEKSLKYLSSYVYIPETHLFTSFYNATEYIKSYAELLIKYLQEWDQHDNSHILFTYHGLPIRDLKRPALQKHTLCDPSTSCPIDHPVLCYRGQCYSTTRAIAAMAGLANGSYSTAFQSRLGKLEWIKPYASDVLQALYQQGVRHLRVICPSFVVDCLETLEEIDIRLRKDWIKMGGESFQRVPCLNSNPEWISGIAEMLLQKMASPRGFEPLLSP